MLYVNYTSNEKKRSLKWRQQISDREMIDFFWEYNICNPNISKLNEPVPGPHLQLYPILVAKQIATAASATLHYDILLAAVTQKKNVYFVSFHS